MFQLSRVQTVLQGFSLLPMHLHMNRRTAKKQGQKKEQIKLKNGIEQRMY